MNTTLPRTIEGLLCRGAPVVETGEGCGNRGERGTVIEFPQGLRVAWASSMITAITYGSDLDLDDPLGGDIAARWAWDTYDVSLDDVRHNAACIRRACLILADREEVPAVLRDLWKAWNALPQKTWHEDWKKGVRAILHGHARDIDFYAHSLRLTRNWKGVPPEWPARIEAALAALETNHG